MDGTMFLGNIIVHIKRFQMTQDIMIHIMNSPAIKIVHITKIYLLNTSNQENLFTNFKKKSLKENTIDDRKQEVNTTCYIQPSQQQKRNCL